MEKRRVPGLALLLCCACAITACSPLYVIRAGYHEARILSGRRPIERVIQDPATAPDTRRKLELVVEARSFAEQRLGLAAGESYTTFSRVDRDTLLMVVTASQPDRFKAHTWWFPIVGHVPYKGYFQFDQAFAEADRLRAQGLDTYVRPSAAFSTLGFFNDPLLSTLLRYGDVDLASTVIHEILHNTVYVPSQVAFNESFASFVGDRGAIELFCERDGASAPSCEQAQKGWHDTKVYGAFLTDLTHRLEAIYGRSDIGRDEKLRLKAGALEAARGRYATEVLPRLQTTGFRGFGRTEVNNATLIGVRLYYERLDLFDRVYAAYGSDLKASIDAILAAAKANPADPYGAVENLVRAPAAR